MRCRRFRLIILTCFISFFCSIVLYNKYRSVPQHFDRSPWTIVKTKNQTYRIPSSSFRYDIRGPFLNFAYFNVEQRQRVLRLDSLYDVPLSCQWQSKGYYYPIQIAQFGLSHWSRFVSHWSNRRTPMQQIDHLKISDQDGLCSAWHSVPKEIYLLESFIHFTIPSSSSLHFHLMKNNVTVIYSTFLRRSEILAREVHINIANAPRSVNRYLWIDLSKIWKKPLEFQNDFLRIRLCGQVNSTVDQLILGNQTLYHYEAFRSATRWLLDHQDSSTGCWFNRVKREFGRQHQYHLSVPWCSAMAQGQAASLLVRLYSRTKSPEHLMAIRRAVLPLWSSNRTRAYFKDRFLWLEEYPLEKPSPGLFVLNGCLYTLISLLDVQAIDPQEYLSQLIEQLRLSLHEMLPFYIHPTEPNWSLYDLGHLTIGSPVNKASFAYHLVHITLLQILSQLFRLNNPSTSRFLDEYVRRFHSVVIDVD